MIYRADATLAPVIMKMLTTKAHHFPDRITIFLTFHILKTASPEFDA
jgi:hypothetical protein